MPATPVAQAVVVAGADVSPVPRRPWLSERARSVLLGVAFPVALVIAWRLLVVQTGTKLVPAPWNVGVMMWDFAFGGIHDDAFSGTILSFGPRQKGYIKARVREIADQYLQMVGLEKFAGRFPHQLSGGMKQRVAIARVLANECELLLMDEPFGALDALTRESLQQELLEIWARTGVTVIFVTHPVEEAVLLSDRVVVMTAGPGRREADIPIQLERARDVSAPDFNRVRRELTQRLTSHVTRREIKASA